MTRDIEQRKRDHLVLAQNDALNFSISAGFDRWRFIHNALPEINLNEIDTGTTFLGKELQFPLLISSMSGGIEESFNFNANLATAAESVGCALGLGSVRAGLENEQARDSFLIAREKAPTAIIMANLGIAQIMDSQSMDRVATFCGDLQANALIIHLNSLQEAFQPEGDTQFKGALNAIKTWVREFPLPLIVKEVGQGLSIEVIQKLQEAGIKIIDIAGAGGSNWISIERERLSEDQSILKQTAHEFANWGEPTAEVLETLGTDMCVIASGGLKRPLDLPKALALGANMGGIAGALLKQAMATDTGQLIEQLLVWKKTLKMAMFGVGVSMIDELIGNRHLLHKID
ncbi:MAG: type 2 isopentenyl-diphosphate Delta-isomerase [Candidatus Marinimicrobia bacterium]|nr:type 2 isopentenyl-diphosphate Delta-isomerase [Candidatus Neomarinimicrobiota bacterium]MBT4360538.1 type 2 isopentenyl-diphosphate Delta-isomerase [Candidatus Neomarinimicrobiota bacterium]MBT4716291.1 type 2 isopentenyl-diphosphate Delta-isomerase [Candidatus Neomarinimicrobiota bacterium]MBT4945247.1 type 2 isopentenyl-diphosphate Delta-isomerase [Candidatus Neomarinimicrobiota bacterium]MBT5269161.1 type 2 isopentenyl-diphosphate Delta-isomerase [Candidatus Neomarinimicrobiota bacterium